jgi:hypothetical protein
MFQNWNAPVLEVQLNRQSKETLSSNQSAKKKKKLWNVLTYKYAYGNYLWTVW